MAAARMKDIAKDLGVSLMTVSKALRNHSDISERTRERVLKRARQLKYQPNWIARSLVTRRTYMVGLVIPDLMHSFFAEVAKGVSRKFEPHGYQIVLSNSEENPETEKREIDRGSRHTSPRSFSAGDSSFLGFLGFLAFGF